MTIEGKCIELEVIKNTSAYHLYNKLGYDVIENRDKKILMQFKLYPKYGKIFMNKFFGK